VEFVPIEDGGGVAKYVIDSTFDVGIDVVLAAVVGEKRVLMAEEAAMLEDGAVTAIGYGDGLSGVARCVFEGDVVGLEARAVDLDGFGEEGPAGRFGVQRVGDDNILGRLAQADEGDVRMILRDDDAFAVGAGDDLDIDAASMSSEGVVVERVLHGRKGGEVLTAWINVRGGGVDADVDVDGVKREGENEHRGNEEASHWGDRRRLWVMWQGVVRGFRC
jgi:hypothetical protein